MAFRTTLRKQRVCTCLYNPPEILANSGIRAIAVSVTYRKHDKAENPGSIPVSATNSFIIRYLQKRCAELVLLAALRKAWQGRNPNQIRDVMPNGTPKFSPGSDPQQFGSDGDHRPVTSEVAGSSPVVPAILFNHLPGFDSPHLPPRMAVCSRCVLDRISLA